MLNNQNKIDVQKFSINQDLESVIESPDGSLSYLKPENPHIYNKYNPYINLNNNNNNNNYLESSNYSEIVFNNNLIPINSEFINLAIEIEYLSFYARIITMLDYFTNLIIFFLNYYYSFYNLFLLVISFIGYISTYTFDKKGLLIYLLYQYFQSLIKIYLSLIITLYYIQYNKNITYDSINVLNENLKIYSNKELNYSIIYINTFFQIYITYFLHKFYKKIPNNYLLNNYYYIY